MRTDYVPPEPPHGIDFQTMSAREARDHLNWYVSNIGMRTEVLTKLMLHDGVNWTPDCSEGSLRVIGDWFQTQVSMSPRPKVDVQRDQATLPEWFQGDIQETDLNSYTMWLCQDIGGYLGHLFCERFPNVHWMLQKGKMMADFNQPVIGKFKGGMTTSPFRLMTVIAYKVTDGKSASQEILNLLTVYADLVP